MSEELVQPDRPGHEEFSPVQPFDVYDAKHFSIDLASGRDFTTFTIKTWGDQFASKPVVLIFNKEVAAGLLERLKKAVDGLV